MDYLAQLQKEGYDVASFEEVKTYLSGARHDLANVWECVKHARNQAKVGAIGAHLDTIENCIAEIERTLAE